MEEQTRPAQEAACPSLAQKDCSGSAAQFHPPASEVSGGGFCLLSTLLGYYAADSGWREAGGRQEVYGLGLEEIVWKSF